MSRVSSISMVVADSSSVGTLLYVPQFNLLMVHFKNNDTFYQYNDVPIERATSLIISGNYFGQVFNEMIKNGGFKYSKMTEKMIEHYKAIVYGINNGETSETSSEVFN